MTFQKLLFNPVGQNSTTSADRDHGHTMPDMAPVRDPAVTCSSARTLACPGVLTFLAIHEGRDGMHAMRILVTSVMIPWTSQGH